MNDNDDVTQEAVDRIDSILQENLDQAAVEGADGEAIAEVLLKHRDGILFDGLDKHVGRARVANQ